MTDPNDPHALSGTKTRKAIGCRAASCSAARQWAWWGCPRCSPRPAAAAAAPARPGAALDRRRRQARPRRHAQGRLRRRRHGRDAQPVRGRDAHRRVARAEPLRPAARVEPRPLDQPRPRARDQRERRRDRVRDQAPPRRRVPQRQVVRRRRPDLLDPAHVEAGQLRVGAVRRRHQPRRAEGGQPDHRPRPAQVPGRRPRGQLRLLEHVDRAGRRDRLHEAGRHRPVHVRVVQAGHPEHVQGQPELLGHGQAVRRRAPDHRRSTTTPPA